MRRAWGVMALALSACDDPPKPAAEPPEAGDPAPPTPPPPREGCLRGVTLDGVETDPACIAKQPPSEDTVRAAMKRVEVSVTPDTPETYGGSTVLLSVTFKNLSTTNEATLWLEARAKTTGTRTDWSRMVGVPEPHAGTADQPRLFFPMTTTDTWDRDVDGVPTTGQGNAPTPVALQVRIKPGGKVTHVVSWVAVKIPAPPPMYQDDAGHRFYPKTTAFPLTPGDYGVTLDVPIFGLSKEERKQSLRLKVLPAPPRDLDAGR